MNIVDVDITTLRRSARRGRARSPETIALIQAIDDLTPGKAKAIVIEGGETAEKLQSRLAYAAKAAGKRLQIAIEEDRVLFALREDSRRRRRRRRSTS